MQGGHVYYCYATGTGAASKWAKLSGGLALLPSAKIAYDSRTTGGAISPGQTRNVSLIAGDLPAGASGALVILIVTQTKGSGYLNLYATGAAASTISAINYFGAGQTLTTTTVTRASVAGSVTVKCGGAAGTHFVVGVIGYYP